MQGTPWFLGVGFHEPHLDWRMPAVYLEHYPPTDEIPLAHHRAAQRGRPPVSIHCPYQGASFEKKWEGWGYVDPWTPMRNSSAREMRRHYWAATSWMDHNVGRLLGELERTKQNALTIVVFHSVRTDN